MKRTLAVWILGLISISSCWGQYTLVPDPNFEQALIDLGIDSEGVLDGQFLTADALGVQDLSVYNKGISSLEGIEAFVDLEYLSAGANSLSTIDFSSNVSLNSLNLIGNLFTGINLSALQNLVYLNISDNPLESIDLSPLPSLSTLFLRNCNLTSLDLSSNVNLIQMDISENDFVAIDLSNNGNLLSLRIEACGLTELDLSTLVNLVTLHAEDNNLTSIDVSNLNELINLHLEHNQLNSLDLGGNPNLELLICYNNQLTTVDLSQNPQMESLDCSRNNVATIEFGDIGEHLWLFAAVENNLTDVDLSNFPILQDLYLLDNQFESLDVSQNPMLRNFFCSNNPINTLLDLSQNSELIGLGFADTMVPSFDVSQCPSLSYLDFDNTHVLEADLSANPMLLDVYCIGSQFLETVDVRSGNNVILDFDGWDSPNFRCIYVDDVNSGEGSFNVDPHTNLVNNEAECEALGIGEQENTMIAIFPNPVNATLHIANKTGVSIDKLVLSDFTGKVLFMGNTNLSEIDLSNYESGIYLLSIHSGNNIDTFRVIKN